MRVPFHLGMPFMEDSLLHLLSSSLVPGCRMGRAALERYHRGAPQQMACNPDGAPPTNSPSQHSSSVHGISPRMLPAVVKGPCRLATKHTTQVLQAASAGLLPRADSPSSLHGALVVDVVEVVGSASQSFYMYIYIYIYIDQDCIIVFLFLFARYSYSCPCARFDSTSSLLPREAQNSYIINNNYDT